MAAVSQYDFAPIMLSNLNADLLHIEKFGIQEYIQVLWNSTRDIQVPLLVVYKDLQVDIYLQALYLRKLLYIIICSILDKYLFSNETVDGIYRIAFTTCFLKFTLLG